jgi:hypothetical protein
VKEVARLIKEANKHNAVAKTIDGFEVELIRGSAKSRKRLLDLDGWELLTLHIDTILELPKRLARECGVPAEEISEGIKSESIQSCGVLEIWLKHFNNNVHHPVILVPGSAHYSWQKAAAIIGIGSAHVRKVPLDLWGRMDTTALGKMVEDCFQSRTPIMSIVAVCGTTEEGAVDPIDFVVQMRETYRRKGFDFWIHVDGAYGGYLTSMVRQDWEMPPVSSVEGPLISHAAYVPQDKTVVSQHVYQQLKAVRDVDSISVDPHKVRAILT